MVDPGTRNNCKQRGEEEAMSVAELPTARKENLLNWTRGSEFVCRDKEVRATFGITERSAGGTEVGGRFRRLELACGCRDFMPCKDRTSLVG